MVSQIYVNLPVKDLQKTIDFFSSLGFTFNPQFTDENATCMIIGENIYAMLLVEPFFKTFAPKQLADAKKTTESILAISVNSRIDVDTMVEKAIRGGGSAHMDKKDHGWMYQHGFEDLDGHIWEVLHIDESAIPQG